MITHSNHYGPLIRQWRIKRGLCVNQCSELAALSTTWLDRCEKGKAKRSSMRNVSMLIQVLRIPREAVQEYIYGRQGKRYALLKPAFRIGI